MMSPRTDPRRTVHNVARNSQLLPVLGFAIAVLLYLGWTEREWLADWWDGDDPALHLGPSDAKADLVSIFSTDDYPRKAIRAEESGVVAVALTVGRRGRVDDCEITQSSGSDALDRATCRIISKRARFEPARDAFGRRIEGSATARIRWELPPE